jgi:hypothetical protein
MTISHDDHAASGRSGLAREGDRRATAAVRLAVGLIQGVALWWLTRSWPNEYRHPPVWPATDPWLFGCLFVVFAFLPVVLLAGVGRLRPVTLIVWGGIAGAVLAALAFHDIDRQGVKLDDTVLSPVFLPFAAVALFITHHLIVPADRERRLIAPYPAYFDAAWMAGVQLALSIGFAGAFWLLLFLGAALFKVIGLSFLGDLIQKTWFAFPLTGLAFATAVQLTDVRDGLIRGVRAVALMLLSWLLLVMTVLAAGFLAALPFTGLQGLWNTGSATALVLASAGALIILINTAYQDGRTDNRPPLVLRIAVQVASLLLTPLIVLAVWGLMLRIGQYGLTPDRIIAAACALVGAVYAIGYGLGAVVPLVRKGSGWMKALEATNLASGVLAVAVILALFSPLADPARLSVADQVKRLEAGKVTPEQFDYLFLARRSGKAGERALATLKASHNPRIAGESAKAHEDLMWPRFGRLPESPKPTAASIRIQSYPAGAALPRSFVDQFDQLVEVIGQCRTESPCEARQLDLDRDGVNEVLIATGPRISVFKHEVDGRWLEWVQYSAPDCVDNAATRLKAPFRDGRVTMAPPAFPDLVVGGVRLRMQVGDLECPAPAPLPR